MKLTELGFATESVKLAKGDLTLRGLSLSDILSLYRANAEALRKLYTQVTLDTGQKLSLENESDVVALIAASAPEIVAQIIAMAADEPTAVDVARRLAFPVQIEALEKIGKLTFSQEGGPKKVVEAIVRMTGGITSLGQDLQT